MKFNSIFVALLILLSPIFYSNSFKLIGVGVAQASAVTEQQVAELYVATFNRAPDKPGLDFWVNDSGFTIEQIAESFFDQTETQDLYPLGTTETGFVTSVYNNLFNRAPDAGGLAYWVGALGSGAVTRPVMIEAVKNGAQGTDAEIVANKGRVGLYYASLGLDGGGFSLVGVTDELETVFDAMGAIDAIASKGSGEIIITNHFPESGPAGSYLFLKLTEPVSDLGSDFTIQYNQEALDINTIIKTGEDTLQVTIPTDAVSGDVQIVSGGSVSNTVNFSVISPVATPLLSQSLSPSATDQVINYNDDILITIPSDILDTTRTLSITKMEGAPVNSTAPFAAASAFDVSIEGLEQLNGYIEIKVKYNPDLLNPEYPAEDQFMAMRWNEAEQSWLPLPYQVDTINNTLNFYTDHLTLLNWAVISLVAPITWVGEKLFNDVYVTPYGNFRLLYGKSSILEHVNLNDNTWSKIFYTNPWFPLEVAYQSEHPKFIQDLGNLHETALSNYVKHHGFQDPIVKPGILWGTAVNPITVKVDSWWVSSFGAPNYEKVFENIHLPTKNLTDFEPYYSTYGTIGHELFHRIQAEYYGISGFLYPSNLWWIEAVAEYAGHRVAWPNKQLDCHLDDIGADFFSYPLNYIGVPSGWGEKRHEYAASVFIQFLVETKGLDFKEMVEYVVQGDPLSRLDEFLLLKLAVSLKDFYAEFAAWAVFSENGFMGKNGFSAADIAGQVTNFPIPENDILTIEVDAESDDMFVNVYITEENQRFPGDGIPSLQGTLKNGESLDMPVSNLGQSNVLYLLATTGKENSLFVEDPYNGSISYLPQTELTVTVKNKNKNPVEQIKRSFTLEGNYLAKLWGVNLEVLQPDINSSSCPMIYDLALDDPNGVSDGIGNGYWINNSTQCTYEFSLKPYNLRSEIPYLGGEKHGLVKSFRYKSSSYIGTVESTTNFDHGEADIRRYYDELGQQTSCRYIVNGKATNQVCP